MVDCWLIVRLWVVKAVGVWYKSWLHTNKMQPQFVWKHQIADRSITSWSDKHLSRIWYLPGWEVGQIGIGKTVLQVAMRLDYIKGLVKAPCQGFVQIVCSMPSCIHQRPGKDITLMICSNCMLLCYCPHHKKRMARIKHSIAIWGDEPKVATLDLHQAA